MPPEWFRIVCYAVGVIGSIILAGQLLGTRYRLGSAFAGFAFGWAANALLLASMLLYQMATGEMLPWMNWLLTFNALIIAVAPAIVLAVLNRIINGGSRDTSTS